MRLQRPGLLGEEAEEAEGRALGEAGPGGPGFPRFPLARAGHPRPFRRGAPRLEGTAFPVLDPGNRRTVWISKGDAGYTSFMMTHSTMVMIQTTSAPDTVVTAMPSGFLNTAEAVSTVFLALVVLGVLLALIGVLWQLRKLARSVGEVTKRLEKDAGPVLERARSVAENVDFITAVVRTDVQKLNDTVTRLNDRLRNASERMEERLQDFTALVEVLQTEAEAVALDTAAAVRGVRAGTRTLAGGDGPDVDEEAPGARALPASDREMEG